MVEKPLTATKRKANMDLEKLGPEMRQLEEQYVIYIFCSSRTILEHATPQIYDIRLHRTQAHVILPTQPTAHDARHDDSTQRRRRYTRRRRDAHNSRCFTSRYSRRTHAQNERQCSWAQSPRTRTTSRIRHWYWSWCRFRTDVFTISSTPVDVDAKPNRFKPVQSRNANATGSGANTCTRTWRWRTGTDEWLNEGEE